MNVQYEFKCYFAKIEIAERGHFESNSANVHVVLLQTRIAHKNLVFHFSAVFLVNVYLNQQGKSVIIQ